MLREAAERTGDAVGDGTTTPTILAHAIFAEGMRNIAAGASAIDLKRGLDRGAQRGGGRTAALSRPVASQHGEGAGGDHLGPQRSHDRRAGRATPSRRSGAEGAVTVEEAKGTETTLEVVEGMQFDRGYLSPYFVTDAEKMEAVLDDPLILLHEKKISIDEGPAAAAGADGASSGASLLIVAEDVEARRWPRWWSTSCAACLPNAAVKAPGFGDRRKAMLRGHRHR